MQAAASSLLRDGPPPVATLAANRDPWSPHDAARDLPLAAVIADFTAICGVDWKPVTRRKYAADFARLVSWLESAGRPATLAALDLATLAAYVTDLRHRPKMIGDRSRPPEEQQWIGPADNRPPLSANSVNCYVRPIRALAGWLVDEGHLRVDPFRRARRGHAHNPLLPVEETPAKGASLDDLRALELGCAGDRPLELRDRAIVAVLVTTAARNSSVRLLLGSDVNIERTVIRFTRAKGGKTLEVALQPDARAAIERYLADGRSRLLRGAPDLGYLFLAHHGRGAPLSMSALSLMLTRRYHAGGGTLPYFGSHRIRHGTATLLVNNGMPLEEVSRYLGHSSTDVTRRYARHTPETLGLRAADALARAGLVGR